MDLLDNITQGLERLPELMEQAARNIMASPGVKASLVNLNREQMDAGTRADGLAITLDGNANYSPLTVEIKKEKGQPYDRITLRDTGQFYENLEVQIGADGLIFRDTDLKTLEIVERTGPAIFGLTDDNVGRVIEFIAPIIGTQIRTVELPNILTR